MSTACIIPTHERPDLLRRAIESVFAQTELPARIVVVEDGYDPATSAVVENFDNAPVPVEHVQFSSNYGSAGATRNAGAQAATDCDFLAFLDDDDEWEESFLARTHEAFRLDESLSFAVTWTEHVAGNWRGAGLQMPEGYNLNQGVMINPGFTGSNFVIRRNVFTSVGGFDPALRVANDLDLLVRLLMQDHTYGVIPVPLVRQHVHGDGQLSIPDERRARGLRAYGQKHSQLFTRKDRRELRRLYHANMRHADISTARKALHLVGQALVTPPQTFGRGLLRRARSTPDYGSRRAERLTSTTPDAFSEQEQI